MSKDIKLTPFYYDYVYGQPYQVILQIGGRFSSKSYNSQIELTGNMMAKEDYTLLVIEDLESNMKDGYYAGLVDKIEMFEHTPAYKITKSPTEITNKLNGNKALFRGYKLEQQKKAVKAIDQVTEIIVEEGEWLEYDDFIALLHQLRGGHPQDRKLTVLMNPVNEYCFVNEMFIKSTPDKVIEYFPGTNRPKVFEKNIETTFEYEGVEYKDITKVLVCLSTHHDNNYLTLAQRATIEKLKETDPDKYKQLGEARFIKSGGVFFNEFSRDVHVVKAFPIPTHWRWYFVMDYGLDMLAGYYVAVNDNNKAFFVKEIYESDLIISEAAKKIIYVGDGIEVYENIGPPDLWNRRQETGRSAEEIFDENGLPLYKANNNRVQGWLDVKEWLKPYKDEQGILTANLQVFDNCENLIRCMEQVKKSEKDPNDVAKEPHELTHAPDAVRYFCAGRPVPYVAPDEHIITESEIYEEEVTDWEVY